MAPGSSPAHQGQFVLWAPVTVSIKWTHSEPAFWQSCGELIHIFGTALPDSKCSVAIATLVPVWLYSGETRAFIFLVVPLT